VGLRRYVALGDSFTEGLDDPRPDGSLRGWADRVADAIAAAEGSVFYANLAVRSRRMNEVVDEQVPVAVAMQPNLATIAAGGNDLLGVRVDVGRIADRLDEAVDALAATGATVVMFTGFDPRLHLPPGRLLARRTAAFNERIRATARRHNALLGDLWHMRELADPALWSPDRLHLSSLGHRQIAGVVLEMLGYGAYAHVSADVVTETPWTPSRRHDLVWARRHFAPWVVRKVRGRSMGHGMTPKYPRPVQWPREPVVDYSD
jgi:lysophospholipase L1-like esterase